MKISNRVRSAVCVLLYISYTAIYMARLNLSMSSDALTGAEILTDVEYGILGGAFLVVYALGRLFNGWLSDRLPPRTMICAGLLLSGAANIVFSALPPFSGMLVLWSLNAFAQSMLWSPILRVVAAMYDRERAGKITSLMVTSVAAGNIVGIVVNTALIVHYGTRFAFIIPGGINLLLGAAVLILLGRTGIGTTETDKSAQPVSQAPLVSLLRRPDMLAVVAYAFAHGIMKDNITVWMTKYFIAAYDIDLTKASYFVIFIPAVGFVGRMLYPLVYRLTGQKEHIASLFGFVICLASSVPLCFGVASPVAAMVCLGLVYAAVSVINTSLLSIYPIRFVPQGRVATVSGMMDFSTYLGAGISSSVYGFLVSSAGYPPMYGSWAVVSALSALSILLFLVPRKKRENGRKGS